MSTFRILTSLFAISLCVLVITSAGVIAQEEEDSFDTASTTTTTTTTSSSTNVNLDSGKVIELTDENFDTLTASGDWLIAFTAPWCGHCKTLYPIWQQAAEHVHSKKPSSSSSSSSTSSSSSKFYFGRVDCTAHTVVSGRFSITGYPTLKYFSNGKFISDYRQARTVQALVDFVDRVSGPAVRTITASSAGSEWRDLMKQSSTSALFTLVGSVKKSDPSIYQTFSSVAKTLQTQLSFAHVSDVSLFKELVSKLAVSKSSDVQLAGLENAASPFVAVIKDNSVTLVSSASAGLSSSESFEKFVNTNRFPTVVEFGQTTYSSLTALGKPLALLLLDGTPQTLTSPSSNHLYKEFVAAGTSASESESLKSFSQFAWMDAKTFHAYVSSTFGFYASDIPTVLVWEPSSGVYYTLDKETSLKALTRDIILNFIKDVSAGKVESRGGNGLVENVKKIFRNFLSTATDLYKNQPILFFGFCLIPIAFVIIIAMSFSDDGTPVSGEDNDENATTTTTSSDKTQPGTEKSSSTSSGSTEEKSAVKTQKSKKID